MVHEGEYKDDLKHGQGTFHYQNGNVYVGSWFKDKKSGSGKMVYAQSGSVYEGNWVNDQRNGFGKCSYMNGNIFEGSDSIYVILQL